MNFRFTKKRAFYTNMRKYHMVGPSRSIAIGDRGMEVIAIATGRKCDAINRGGWSDRGDGVIGEV